MVGWRVYTSIYGRSVFRYYSCLEDEPKKSRFKQTAVERLNSIKRRSKTKIYNIEYLEKVSSEELILTVISTQITRIVNGVESRFINFSV